MDKLLVEGYKSIESVFGYWPTFHDDVIDKIEISNEGITFYIKLQSPPNGINSYDRIKLIFSEVEKFSLEGEPYGCASIIYDLEVKIIDNCKETQISSSLGASGIIRSKRIQIELQMC